MDWNKLLNKIISVLITGKDNKKETYVGTLENCDNDYIILNPNNPSFHLERIYIRKDLIESIWVYKREKRGTIGG